MRPLREFRWVTSTYTLKDGTKRTRRYQLNYCNDCKRAQDRAKSARRRREQPEYLRDWRRNNPDKVKAAQDRYNASEKGKASRRRYAATPKGRATQARYRQKPEVKRRYREADRAYQRRRRMIYRAMLPGPVVRPFVERLLREFQPPRTRLDPRPIKRNEGAQALATAVGVDEKMIRNILNGKKAVSLEVADALARYGDFTLEELTERAQEWALLTGSKWPEGYMPTGQARVRRRSRS